MGVKIMDDLAAELAGELMARASALTPEMTGNLRQSWRVAPEATSGRVHRVRVENTAPYASHVEQGHRGKGGQEWVPGRFFLREAEAEVARAAPAMVKRRLAAFLKEWSRDP